MQAKDELGRGTPLSCQGCDSSSVVQEKAERQVTEVTQAGWLAEATCWSAG